MRRSRAVKTAPTTGSNRYLGRIITAAVFLGMIGCEKKPPAAPTSLKQFADVRGTSILRGHISFAGTPPKFPPVKSQPGGSEPLTEQTVAVDETGGLKNVVITVEGLPAVDGKDFPAVLIDQIDAVYSPHVVIVNVNQPLTIRSSDDTLHNVHANASANPNFNLSMTHSMEQQEKRFERPEILNFRCDVHPWMSAFVHVTANPFVALSNARGDYEIRDLPPGTYTVTAWHEFYGTQSKQVTLTEAATADFIYPPSRPSR